MSIGSISGITSGTSLASSSATIAGNFDSFLQLLTTQLKNQNPLDPLNSNEFTQQLVQFSSVEQQLKTNQFLESLILSSQTSTTSQAVSFIGKEISASSTMTNLKGGSASWLYNLQSAADKVYVSIKNSDGTTVYSKELSNLAAGDGRFDWDGVNDSGVTQPDGAYQIQIDARNEDGNPITATTQMAGIVDGVDFSGDEPFLTIGKSYVALASIISVRATT